jgi:hypothetical protein
VDSPTEVWVRLWTGFSQVGNWTHFFFNQANVHQRIQLHTIGAISPNTQVGIQVWVGAGLGHQDDNDVEEIDAARVSP